MSAESIWILVLAVAVVAVLLLIARLVAVRLDRLHKRTDIARDALFAALAARHSAAERLGRLEGDDYLVELVADARGHRPEELFVSDTHAADPAAERAENALGLALAARNSSELPGDMAAELEEVSDRLEMARRFHNDAVRDTRSLRSARGVRLFRLAGRAPLPDYVELVADHHLP